MTTRQIRRAAERKTRKLARKADLEQDPSLTGVEEAFPDTITPEEVEHLVANPPTPHYPNRAAANKANAQHSTGPRTPEGKASSSKNATKFALTGRTVLLPADDAQRYEDHLLDHKKRYRPLGEREHALVQSLADTLWRIDRIAGIEQALYLRGRDEFAAEVTDLDPQAQASDLELRTYLAYERQLRTLHAQEMRLHRMRERLGAEIKQIQQDREAQERKDLDVAAKLYIAAKNDHRPWQPSDDGFDFPIEDVHAYLRGVRATLLTQKAAANGKLPL